MRKQIVAILLTGVLAVSLTACSQHQKEEQDSKNSSVSTTNDKDSSVVTNPEDSKVTVTHELAQFFQTHSYSNFEILASNGRMYYRSGDEMLVVYADKYRVIRGGKSYMLNKDATEYYEGDDGYTDTPYAISSIVIEPNDINVYAQKSDGYFYDTRLEDSEEEVGMFKYKVDGDTITVAVINYSKDLGDITTVDPVMQVTYKVSELLAGEFPYYDLETMKKIDVEDSSDTDDTVSDFVEFDIKDIEEVEDIAQSADVEESNE